MSLIVNSYGRQWEYLDAVRYYVDIKGAFSVSSSDGFPLCGRSVVGQVPVKIVAKDWKLA